MRLYIKDLCYNKKNIGELEMKTHNKMKTIITHGLTIFATFLIVGSSSVINTEFMHMLQDQSIT